MAKQDPRNARDAAGIGCSLKLTTATAIASASARIWKGDTAHIVDGCWADGQTSNTDHKLGSRRPR